jgi:hypothetical protein
VKFVALQNKDYLKEKRFDISLKQYTFSSEHGGLLTAENLENMDELNYNKQLVAEVSYKKSTIKKEININTRVTETKKFKMVPLPSTGFEKLHQKPQYPAAQPFP